MRWSRQTWHSYDGQHEVYECDFVIEPARDPGDALCVGRHLITNQTVRACIIHAVRLIQLFF